MHPVQHPLLFQVGNVLVHGRQALQLHAPRNLFEGRRIAVTGHKRFQKIQNFFLSSSYGHGRIIANKKRSATPVFSPLVYFLGTGAVRVSFTANSEIQKEPVPDFLLPLSCLFTPSFPVFQILNQSPRVVKSRQLWVLTGCYASRSTVQKRAYEIERFFTSKLENESPNERRRKHV